MVNHRLRRIIWCRKWSKTEWTIVAVGFAIFIFAFSLISDSTTKNPAASGVPLDSSPTDLVPLTLLRNAKEKGAFCLDGSVPGYHFQKGFGSGSNNWILHVEGGGWCNSVSSCSDRKTTALGSSNYMERQVQFSGILSKNPSENLDFFNWNKVKIRYCDGGSFAGNPESEYKIGTKLFFRGQLIWDAIMDELMSMGMSNSSQALLSGCSAGGLATLIHCDAFQQLFPKDANVKCLSDAGFFLNEKDIAGNRSFESFYHEVVSLQGMPKSLNKDCVSRMEPSKCFFPQGFIQSIKTPVFLVNAAYDFWQIRNVLAPASSDPNGTWLKCRQLILFCNSSQIQVLQGFRDSLLKELTEIQKTKELGLFINSCFIHCQTWMTETWHSPNSPRINDKTIAESVGDWYFNRKVVKEIDCPYPCDRTCYGF